MSQDCVLPVPDKNRLSVHAYALHHIKQSLLNSKIFIHHEMAVTDDINFNVPWRQQRKVGRKYIQTYA